MTPTVSTGFSRYRLLILMAIVALALGTFLPARLLSDDSTHGAKAMDLGDHMDAMGKAFKKLKKEAADGTLGPDSAALVVEMESHAIIAKTLIPPNAKKLAGSEQAAFILGFRTKLITTIGQLLQLETALIENHATEAASLITAVDASEHEGHDAYKNKKK